MVLQRPRQRGAGPGPPFLRPNWWCFAPSLSPTWPAGKRRPSFTIRWSGLVRRAPGFVLALVALLAEQPVAQLPPGGLADLDVVVDVDDPEDPLDHVLEPPLGGAILDGPDEGHLARGHLHLDVAGI